MKKPRLNRFAASVLCLAVTASGILAFGEGISQANWHASNLPFRVLGIASHGPSLWVCGVDESIAVSSDGGEHWQLKHRTPDGNLLLTIGFAGEGFAFASGTGGLILTSDDGGETWTQHPAPAQTILQSSFSDSQHGLIRTPESLMFTADGGKSWATVSAGKNADALKTYPYTFSLVALDSQHMAVMLKQGPAQYEPQTFLVTRDGGSSWQVVDVPDVTLYSFLRAQGRYWAIGTEVIHKDQPGGGYAVGVALYSSDGTEWTHSKGNLSACRPELCVACTKRGCLSNNGTILNVFSEKPGYWAFPSNPKLTAKWAAAGSTMCFLGDTLQCVSLKNAAKPAPAPEGATEPVAVAPGPLGVKPVEGLRCIECELNRFLIDPKAHGNFIIKLAIDVAKDGTVTAVEAGGAPTPAIKSKIEQQVQQWIFEPYYKDGVRVNLKLNTRVQVSVIRPR